jgi:hypothetical protein
LPIGLEGHRINGGNYQRPDNRHVMIKQGVNWIVPTRPSGTSDNSAASTKFVGTAMSVVTANGTAPVGQLPGTVTNDNATAGNVGEFKSANLGSGSALALGSNTVTSVLALALTAGDWDVWGQAIFHVASTTVVTLLVGGINSTSSVQPTSTSGALTQMGLGAGLTGIADTMINAGPTRFSLSTTGTAFLMGTLTFSGSTTASAYGVLQARRVR